MHLWRICRRKPGQSDDNEGATENGRRESTLRRGESVRLAVPSDIAFIVNNDHDDARQEADEDTHECETTDAGGPTTLDLKDDWKSGEAEVEGAVDDRHVDLS